VSRYQKIEQKHSIKTANVCFKDVAMFRYLGRSLTDQNCLPEEIKSGLNMCFKDVVMFRYLGRTLTDQSCLPEEIKNGLNSGNACCHSIQGILSSRLLSRNIKVMYKIISLQVILYGCETWSLTLREEH
jgi:hypothetical protein